MQTTTKINNIEQTQYGQVITGTNAQGNPYAQGVYFPQSLVAAGFSVGQDVEMTFARKQGLDGKPYLRGEKIALVRVAAAPRMRVIRAERALRHRIVGVTETTANGVVLDLGESSPAYASMATLQAAGIGVDDLKEGVRLLGSYMMLPSRLKDANDGDLYARLTVTGIEPAPAPMVRKLNHEVVEVTGQTAHTLTVDFGGQWEASMSKKALGEAGFDMAAIAPGATVMGEYEIRPSTRAGAKEGAKYAHVLSVSGVEAPSDN